MKKTCLKCDKIAVWDYAPNGKYYYCDEHVSRGCSCNSKLDDDGNYLGELLLDDQGRDLPCVEYDYNEEGFDE